MSTICDICHLSFTSEKGMNVHKTKIHNGAPKLFRCKYCDKTMKRECFILQHEKVCKRNPNCIQPTVTNINNTIHNTNTTVNNNVVIVVNEGKKAEVVKKLVPITNELLRAYTVNVINKTNGSFLNGVEFGKALMEEDLKYSVTCTDNARNLLLWRNGDLKNKKMIDPNGHFLASKVQHATQQEIVALGLKHNQEKEQRKQQSELDCFEEDLFNQKIHYCAMHGKGADEIKEEISKGMIEKKVHVDSFLTKDESLLDKGLTEEKESPTCFLIEELKKVVSSPSIFSKSPYDCGRYAISRLSPVLEIIYNEETYEVHYYYFHGEHEKITITMNELTRCWRATLLYITDTHVISKFVKAAKKQPNRMNAIQHLQFLWENDDETYAEQLYRGFMGYCMEEEEDSD